MAGEVSLAEQLRPARLPADFFAISFQDILAAFGVGILVAVALYLIIRPFARRRASALARVTEQLQAFRALPPQERVFRQLSILEELRSGAAQVGGGQSTVDASSDDWKEALYRPDVTVDHDALDERILRIAARVKS